MILFVFTVCVCVGVCDCWSQRVQETSGEVGMRSNHTVVTHCVCHAWSTLITAVLAQQVHEHGHKGRISLCLCGRHTHMHVPHTCTWKHTPADAITCGLICIRFIAVLSAFFPAPPALTSLHENWQQAVITHHASLEWQEVVQHSQKSKGPNKEGSVRVMLV